MALLTACDSDDRDSLQGSTDFPRNTEWVGVLDRTGYQYAPPANLQFRDGDDFVVYAPHFFAEDNVIRLDSVHGNIESVTEIDHATIQVITMIEHYGQVTMTIKDRKTLTSISNNAGKPMPFTMEIYETSEPFGGSWTGPIITSSGPTNGMVAYPDLSTIVFHGDGASYTRHGETVTFAPIGAIPEVLSVAFKRIGATVFMQGYDETTSTLYPYMGVLLPGDRKMLVHSNATGARLPYAWQTIPWYGPIGQTPYIERQ